MIKLELQVERMDYFGLFQSWLFVTGNVVTIIALSQNSGPNRPSKIFRGRMKNTTHTETHYLVADPTNRKWVITPVINGISRVNPLIIEVITHFLSGLKPTNDFFFFATHGPPRFTSQFSQDEWSNGAIPICPKMVDICMYIYIYTLW